MIKKTTLLILLMAFTLLAAESIDDKISSLAEANAKMYVQPFLNSFSAGINSGTYNTAKVLGTLKFGVFINTSLYFVPKSEKTFDIALPSEDESHPDVYEIIQANAEAGNLETATIYGDNGSTLYQYPEINSGNSLKMPNGADLSMIPFLMPQIHVGLPWGNELMLRYAPPLTISEDVGELSFFGIGVKHSIDQYIPLCPIDLAVQGVYHSMKVGDIMEFSSLAFNAEVSKTFLMWTLYGGLGYESTSLTAEYTYEPNLDGEDVDDIPLDQDIKVELDAENDFRATAGFRYSFLLLKIYADYSFCKYPIANAGIGLSF